MKNSGLSAEQIKTTHDTVVKFAKEKEYAALCYVPESVSKLRGEEFARDFLNFQNDGGKTVIHHIIENPQNGYRPGLWAVAELYLKGANLNIQDSLGNTALHSCAALYGKIMDDCRKGKDEECTKEWLATHDPLASDSGNKEFTIFANMADVGALLLLGANPNIRNYCNQTVWDIMSTTANKMHASSTKPQISIESCKRAFFMFFNHEKHKFSSGPAGQTEYLWAPNVVGWVEEVQSSVPARSVAPRALTASSSDDDCCIPANKTAKLVATNYVAAATTRATATATANERGGCTLF